MAILTTEMIFGHESNFLQPYQRPSAVRISGTQTYIILCNLLNFWTILILEIYHIVAWLGIRYWVYSKHTAHKNVNLFIQFTNTKHLILVNI